MPDSRCFPDRADTAYVTHGMPESRSTSRPDARGRPSIAVLVPNWNDARYLPKCLGSITGQEVPPDELVVVDDASTDDSVQVIRNLIAGIPYARLVVQSRNSGVYGAVAAGMHHISSDFVLFLSANDFVLPGIFDRARRVLSENPDVGVWSALAWLVDEQDRFIRLQPSPVLAFRDRVFSAEECRRLAHVHGNWFTGTTLVYRRNALENLGGFDPEYGGLSDLITALSIAARHGAGYSPEPLGIIRMHEGSVLSGTLSSEDRLCRLLERLKARGPMLCAPLWSSAFLERTERRFRFAAVRARRGVLAGATARAGLRDTMLRLIDRVLPAGAYRIRVAAGFLILRPFDLVPTLVHRVFGTMLLRARRPSDRMDTRR